MKTRITASLRDTTGIKDDHFLVYKERDGWHWHVHGRGYPRGPIAYSRPKGYATKVAALSSIVSARAAVGGAKVWERDTRGHFKILQSN